MTDYKNPLGLGTKDIPEPSEYKITTDDLDIKPLKKIKGMTPKEYGLHLKRLKDDI